MTKIVLLYFMALSLLSGCTTIDRPQDPDHHDHPVSDDRNFNTKVLNCIRQSGHHVAPEELTCPLGGEKFTALVLGTHSTMGVHLDLEPISYMRFPVPIPVCPASGFVVAEDDYNDERLTRLRLVVESDTYQAYYQQRHSTYFLYAKTLELLNEKTEDQWWLYLNATWEADNCGDRVRYEEYAHQVINEAELSLSSLDPQSDDAGILSIIIPNMYRRIGDFKMAAEWLTKIDSPTSKDNDELNGIFYLASRLLSEAIAAGNTGRVPVKEADE